MAEQSDVQRDLEALAAELKRLEAEYNIAPRMGIGLILGAGRVSDESDTITATAFEAGAQYNYYFMKPFAGLHAGTEVLYLTLGHCRGHYDMQPLLAYWPEKQRCAWEHPAFHDLLRRGIAWGKAAKDA